MENWIKLNLCWKNGWGKSFENMIFRTRLIFEPYLAGTDVEFVHIALHQRDTKHKLLLWGQIPFCPNKTHTHTCKHATSTVCDSAGNDHRDVDPHGNKSFLPVTPIPTNIKHKNELKSMF